MKFALVLRKRRLALTKARRPQPMPRPSHIFPFFEQPLELREAIYDECFEDHEGELQSGKRLKYRACNTPLTNLLLVSKHFKQEYAARAQKQSHLDIEDGLNEYIARTCNVPRLAAKACRITISIIILPDKVAQELKMHRNWLPRALEQLLSATALQLNLRIASRTVQTKKRDVSIFIRDLYKSSAIPINTEVHSAELDENTVMTIESKFVPVMKWSHEKDRLERIVEKEEKGADN